MELYQVYRTCIWIGEYLLICEHAYRTQGIIVSKDHKKEDNHITKMAPRSME